MFDNNNDDADEEQLVISDYRARSNNAMGPKKETAPQTVVVSADYETTKLGKGLIKGLKEAVTAIETEVAPPKFELVDGLNECNNKQYHDDRKYLSSSVLKTVLESLAKYHNDYILGLKAETSTASQSNFDVGTLVHSMILEPETVATEFNYYKGMRKAGVDFEAFLRSVADPKLPCISINQNLLATEMFKAYSALPEAVELVTNGFAEQTICGTLYGVPIKTRFDWINVDKGYIADVKTTGYSSDLETFKETVASFQYDLSAALYTLMAEQYYGKPFDFYYIVLSKKDKTCDVYKTSKKTMYRGKEKVAYACAKYLQAKSTNVWTDIADPATIISSSASTTTKYKIEDI